jgi:hypothetical protein
VEAPEWIGFVCVGTGVNTGPHARNGTWSSMFTSHTPLRQRLVGSRACIKSHTRTRQRLVGSRTIIARELTFTPLIQQGPVSKFG